MRNLFHLILNIWSHSYIIKLRISDSQCHFSLQVQSVFTKILFSFLHASFYMPFTLLVVVSYLFCWYKVAFNKLWWNIFKVIWGWSSSHSHDLELSWTSLQWLATEPAFGSSFTSKWFSYIQPPPQPPESSSRDWLVRSLTTQHISKLPQIYLVSLLRSSLHKLQSLMAARSNKEKGKKNRKHRH